MTKDELRQAMARAIAGVHSGTNGSSVTKYGDLAQSALTAIIEAGYAVVPREASEGMCEAYVRSADGLPRKAHDGARHFYTAMIEAGEIKP